MSRMNDAINRRVALIQLTAATMLAAGAAKAQRPDPSLTQIKTTDLGHKTYMLEGQGGNVLVVIGDDGIIMVDAELAPVHERSRRPSPTGRISRSSISSIPISTASRPVAMRRFIAMAPSSWRRIMCVCASLPAPQAASKEPAGEPGRDPDRDLCGQHQDRDDSRSRGAPHPCHECAY